MRDSAYGFVVRCVLLMYSFNACEPTYDGENADGEGNLKGYSSKKNGLRRGGSDKDT